MTSQFNEILDSNSHALTAGLITVYNVDEVCREYIGSSAEYLIVGVGLPALSYIDAPPAALEGYAICRNSTGDAWEQIEDHRGDRVYDTTTQQSSVVQNPGAIDASLTLLAPVTAYDVWNGSEWVTDPSAKKTARENAAIAEKAALLTAANAKTQLWQTQLMLGIITDGDKLSLTSWMKYVQAVQAIDTTAVEIIWPPIPG